MARRTTTPTIVASEAEAIAKMRAAADKHLDIYSPEHRQQWAERTARAYIAKGIIVIAASR